MRMGLLRLIKNLNLCSQRACSHLIGAAGRDIAAGEEVTDNYGKMFSECPLEDRQSFLEDKFWFRCRCTACRGESLSPSEG